MKTFRHRVFHAMMGMAIGDAISWPAMFHRSQLLPPWTRRIRREMDLAMETTGVNRLPMPFSLNQPASAFNPGPGNHCEWAAFTAQRLIADQGTIDDTTRHTSWTTLANNASGIRGPVSVLTALSNLRKGVLPPASGNDNPHYFDDASFCRVVPIAVLCAGKPQKAAEWAEIEAAVTNAEDGIWAAKGFAAGISVACGGGEKDAVVAAILDCLPQQSWSLRLAENSLIRARKAGGILEIIPFINESIVNREYSYSGVAPETLAVTLAVLQICGQDFQAALTAACTFAKTAESVPAFAGALCGAMTDQDFLTDSWQSNLKTLKGVSLPMLTGLDYVQLSRQLAALAEEKTGQ